MNLPLNFVQCVYSHVLFDLLTHRSPYLKPGLCRPQMGYWTEETQQDRGASVLWTSILLSFWDLWSSPHCPVGKVKADHHGWRTSL